MEERERIEAAFVQEQRMMPMVHYAQIPSSKVRKDQHRFQLK